MHEYLELYLSKGWKLVPAHELQNGRCTCNDPNCTSQGKHPRVSLDYASDDPELIKSWLLKWPTANWSLRTGRASAGGSGVIAIDVDPQHDGHLTWEHMTHEMPELPDTPTQITPNGGMHIIFKADEDTPYRNRGLGQGVDVRAERALLMVFPSTRADKRYEWDLDPYDYDPAPLPDHVREWLNTAAREPRTIEYIDGKVAPGMRHDALMQQALMLRHTGLELEEIIPPLMTYRDEYCTDRQTDQEVINLARWVSELPAEYRLTDVGDAERLADYYGHVIRYCEKWGAWLVWDGKRWNRDQDLMLMDYAIDVVRSMYREASRITDKDTRLKLISHALSRESKFKLESMISLARHMVPIDHHILDADPHLINLSNGVLDLKTGELLEHDPTLWITKLLDVEYDPDAACPDWLEFMKFITKEDKADEKYLQKAIGYTLTGNVDEDKLFFCYGPPRTGKTTFLQALKQLFGEYAQQTQTERLLMSFRSTGPSPYTARLQGVRLSIGSETPEGRRFNASKLKALTGGDVVVGDMKHKNPIEFTPTHKFWIFGNFKPRADSEDAALWRRIRVIPFNHEVPREVEKPRSKLLEMFNKEASGILNWALEGCSIWQREGLADTDSIREATGTYRDEEDIVSAFIQECCIQSVDVSSTKKEMYAAFREWAKESLELIPRKHSIRWFGNRMKEKGHEDGGAGNQKWLKISPKST